MKFTTFDVDLGTIVLFARKSHLYRLDLLPSSRREEVRGRVGAEFPGAVDSPGLFKTVRGLLSRCFKGAPIEFDVPVDLAGIGTFTGLAPAETRKIGHGKVASYGKIAAALGSGNAAMAVGQALKRNPIPVVIPCHRIVKGDGSLGGFGLGPDLKKKLLAKEGISVSELRTSMILS